MQVVNHKNPIHTRNILSSSVFTLTERNRELPLLTDSPLRKLGAEANVFRKQRREGVFKKKKKVGIGRKDKKKSASSL